MFQVSTSVTYSLDQEFWDTLYIFGLGQCRNLIGLTVPVCNRSFVFSVFLNGGERREKWIFLDGNKRNCFSYSSFTEVWRKNFLTKYTCFTWGDLSDFFSRISYLFHGVRPRTKVQSNGTVEITRVPQKSPSTVFILTPKMQLGRPFCIGTKANLSKLYCILY